MLKQLLALPSNSLDFDAYLYDCDGTLADTMGPHVDAWVEEMRDHGLKIERGLIYELAGMPATKTVEEMNRRFNTQFDPEKIAKLKEERFYQHYLHRIQPIPELVTHLKQMARLKKKIGVVSGGRTRIVKETLKILGVESLVQAMVCAEDVKHGKPHPEPFLIAAKRLGVEPHACLVFEDADLGIQSAEAAGMAAVRVYS